MEETEDEGGREWMWEGKWKTERKKEQGKN